MEGVIRDTPPPQIRVAGVLVGLQGLGAVVFAVLLGIQDAAQPLGAVPGAATGAAPGAVVVRLASGVAGCCCVCCCWRATRSRSCCIFGPA